MSLGQDGATDESQRRAAPDCAVTATAPRRHRGGLPRARERDAGRRAARRSPSAHLRTDRWWLQPLLTVVALRAVHRLLDVPRVPERVLLLRALHLALLLAVHHDGVRGRHLPGAVHRAGVDLPGPLHPGDPAGPPATCYYYRKAYYRSFWLSPPACAVAEPHRRYTGETRAAAARPEPAPVRALRRAGLQRDPHLRRDPRRSATRPASGATWASARSSCWPTRRCSGSTRCPATPAGTSSAAGSTTSPGTRCATRLWTQVSQLNGRHAQFAWLSLFSVAIADFYVFLLATGTISDLRFF